METRNDPEVALLDLVRRSEASDLSISVVKFKTSWAISVSDGDRRVRGTGASFEEAWTAAHRDAQEPADP